MRILVVDYSYPPLVSPRAIRWSAIAENWAGRGHHIDLVCCFRPGLAPYEEVNGVCVHRTGEVITGALLNRFRTDRSATKVDMEKPPGPNSRGTARVKSGLGTLGKWVYHRTWKSVYWPDFACMWYVPTLAKSRRLLSANDYDALISVSDPFTGHLVGMRLKGSQLRLPWLVDIGDPFCFRQGTPVNNSRLYRGLNRSVERKVFGRADAITVTTEPTMEEYADLFPESAEKIRVVPPLMSPPARDADDCPMFPQDRKVRLVFVGTLYKNIRNPGFMLRLFAHLLKTSLADRLELHIIGNVNDCGDCFEPYEQLLGTSIFLHGTLEHSAAVRAMEEADVLVNIGNDNAYQLPSKVVEYAATGKPILNLAGLEQDGSAAFFETYPASLCLVDGPGISDSDQVAGLRQFVEHLPERVDSSTLDRLLAPYQTDSVAAQYLELVDAIAAGREQEE